jgi:hypothetical protein
VPLAPCALALAPGVPPGVVVGGPVPVFVCPGAVRVCPGVVVDGLVAVLVCPGAVLDGLVVVADGASAGEVTALPVVVLVCPGILAGVRAGRRVFKRDGVVTVGRRDGTRVVPTGICAVRVARGTVVCVATAACTRSGSAGGAASRRPRRPTIGRPASGCSPSPPRTNTTTHNPSAVVTTRPTMVRRRRR